MCITKKPPSIDLKTSLYDDFTYVHTHLNRDTPELITDLNKPPDFESFESKLEDVPHDSIHSADGDQMGDLGPSTSPNGEDLCSNSLFRREINPIFFMHHGRVDRLWILWRRQNPEARLNDYADIRERLETPGGGNTTADGNLTQNEMSNPRAMLTDMMPFTGLTGAEDLPVLAVMDSRSELLCYTY
ncbi:hypothetical protein ACHAP5_008220 [Fusarium lateritium]